MARKVSPTRIALLNLKKELKVAKKGHKLLKDKRDGLIKTFMRIIYEARDKRRQVETELGGAFTSYMQARALIPAPALNAAFLVPNTQINLDVTVRKVMSVPVPEFILQKTGHSFSYGLLETTGDLDRSMLAFDAVFVHILELAALEKSAENLAVEIERTRRRVSALENVMIPELQETIKFVGQQLEERARDAVVSTMRVKAMIVAKETV